MTPLRCTFWLLLLINLLVAPATVGAGPVAQDEGPPDASPFVGGEGVVSGQVVNGTAEGQVPAGAEVSLRAFDMDQATFIDAITTTVAADGSFRFEGIDPSAPAQLEPLLWYQGVPFLSDREDVIILSPEVPQASANFVVYEPTQEDNLIHFETVHLILEPSEGRLHVTEVYGVANVGDRVFVAGGESDGLFFPLPAQAVNFQTMDAVAGRYVPVEGGVLDTQPVSPGGTQTVFSYDLPFSGRVELGRTLNYPTAVVNLVVPDDGTPFEGELLTFEESFEAQGKSFRLYTAEALGPGTLLTFSLGSPKGQDSGPLVVGVVALALAAGLALLYGSGYLGTWLQRQPARLSNRRDELIQALADLDDAHEAGRIKEKRYRSQRQKLKGELIELMLER